MKGIDKYMNNIRKNKIRIKHYETNYKDTNTNIEVVCLKYYVEVFLNFEHFPSYKLDRTTNRK